MACPRNNAPVARIDPIFLNQLAKLKNDSRRMYEAIVPASAVQRKWQLPDPGLWDKDLFNLTGANGINKAYDRTCPNRLYRRALLKGPVEPDCQGGGASSGEGRVSDCIASKIQIDYVAIQERAFRFRHMTPVRCAIHALTRRRGHSELNDIDAGAGVGGIFTGMVKYVNNIILSGYNDNSPPVGIPVCTESTSVTIEIDGTTSGQERDSKLA